MVVMASNIRVRRKAPVVVVPAKPTPKEIKELSDNDDQQGLLIQVPVIMSFKGTHHTTKRGSDPATVIKGALQEALVYYYPFAGRLHRHGRNQKLIVNCSGEGVLFIEADANFSLQEIENDILPTCPLLDELLFDLPGSSAITATPLLLFQVTRLTCGGYILGIRFNHAICDMYGIVQLLNAMMELSKGANLPSIIPSWKRELLCARYPPRVTCTHHEYEEVDRRYEQIHKNMVQGSVYFGTKEMHAIRNLVPLSNSKKSFTSFELITACIWKCRTLALQPNQEEIVRLSIACNIRGKDIIDLPSGYYGNTVIAPTVVTKAKELISNQNSLAYALQLVQDSKSKVTKEFVKSLIDLIVVKGRPNFTKYLNWIPSNTMRMGLENVDFGWGTPSYCGVPRALTFMSNFTRFKNHTGENVVAVVLSLPLEAMLRFQQELEKMLKMPVLSSLLQQPIVPMRSML